MLDIEIAKAAYNYLSDSKRNLSAVAIRTSRSHDMIDRRHKLAKILGMKINALNTYLGMLSPSREPIVNEFYKTNPTIKDVKTKAEFIEQSMSNEDIELQKAVARKVTEEELGQNKARKLAQSVAAAPDENAKEKLIEWEFNSDIHNPELVKDRAERFGAHDPLYQDETPSAQESWDKAPDIKAIVDGLTQAVKVFTQLTKRLKKTAKIEGKFSFEASQFIVTKLEKFRDEITNTIELLKGDG